VEEPPGPHAEPGLPRPGLKETPEFPPLFATLPAVSDGVPRLATLKLNAAQAASVATKRLWWGGSE